jgi:hypothetical protein
MTKVRKVIEITIRKFAAHLHCRKNGAIAFAIAAGVAHFHGAPRFVAQIVFRQIDQIN